MDIEFVHRSKSKGAGIWCERTGAPADWTTGTNISIAPPTANFGVSVLTFAAAAGTGNKSSTHFTLPSTFKNPGTDNNPMELQLWIDAGTFSIDGTATASGALKLNAAITIKPGPSATNRAEFSLTLVQLTPNATNAIQDDPNYAKSFGIDIAKKLTAAQKKLMVPGTVIRVDLYPSATVGTNLALLVASHRWVWLGHYRRDEKALN